MSFRRKTQWPSREHVWFLCYIRQLRVHVRHGLINYIDTKPKCRHLKSWPVKGLCSGVYRSEAPSLSYDPIPRLHTVYLHTVYLLLIHTEKGGTDEPERRLEGQQFTRLGRKYQHDWLYLQSVNSDKHLPQRHPLQVYIFRWGHFALASI
jgi:hypothetical protein